MYGLKSFNPLASPYTADGTTLALFPTNNTRTPNPVTNFGNTKRLSEAGPLHRELLPGRLFPRWGSISGLMWAWITAAYKPQFRQGQYSIRGGEAPSRTSNGGSKKLMYSWENILSYNKSVGDHNFYATLAQSIQSETIESYGVSVRDLPYDQQLYYNVGSALTISGVSSGYSPVPRWLRLWEG